MKSNMKPNMKPHTIHCNPDQYEVIKTAAIPNDTDDSVIYVFEKAEQSITSRMLYYNVYTIEQHYGGPEEGGWYYHTYECIHSEGVVAFTTDRGITEGFHDMFKRFLKDAEELEIENDYNEMTRQELENLLRYVFLDKNSHLAIYLSTADRYGEGRLLAIEPAAALSEDTKSVIYD